MLDLYVHLASGADDLTVIMDYFRWHLDKDQGQDRSVVRVELSCFDNFSTRQNGYENYCQFWFGLEPSSANHRRSF